MSWSCWSCEIGETDRNRLPHGSDAPMRAAVRDAYVRLTGVEPDFISSGWGATRTVSDQEDRRAAA